MPDPLNELPNVGAPATRALIAAGYPTLGDLIDADRRHVAQLHGFGPKALRIIDEALAVHGHSLRE